MVHRVTHRNQERLRRALRRLYNLLTARRQGHLDIMVYWKESERVMNRAKQLGWVKNE